MHQSTQPSNRISWPSAFFEASSSLDTFDEVHIVTARSAYADKALELAEEAQNNQGFSEETIRKGACFLVNSQQLSIHESVTVDINGISVCINAETVEDENIMWRALDLVADALDQLDGAYGTITYGDPLKFSISDVPWLLRQ